MRPQTVVTSWKNRWYLNDGGVNTSVEVLKILKCLFCYVALPVSSFPPFLPLPFPPLAPQQPHLSGVAIFLSMATTCPPSSSGRERPTPRQPLHSSTYSEKPPGEQHTSMNCKRSVGSQGGCVDGGAKRSVQVPRRSVHHLYVLGGSKICARSKLRSASGSPALRLWPVVRPGSRT